MKVKEKNMSIKNKRDDFICERSEEEYDAAMAKEAYEEYINSGKKTRPFNEYLKENDK